MAARSGSLSRIQQAISAGISPRLPGLCATIIGSFIAFGAGGAPQDPNVDRSIGPDTPATVAIDQLQLSDALADYGERNADPMALVEAAKIRKMLPPPLDAEPDSGEVARRWEALLARATQLAGPNPTVAGLVDDVRRLKRRDIPLIPLDIKFLHKQIKQKSADRAEVRFLAGQLAVIYIRPVPGVALNLFVYDDLNNLICTIEAGSPDSACRWRPRRDGSFLIDVRNNSAAAVDYDLAINREPVPR